MFDFTSVYSSFTNPPFINLYSNLDEYYSADAQTEKMSLFLHPFINCFNRSQSVGMMLFPSIVKIKETEALEYRCTVTLDTIVV